MQTLTALLNATIVPLVSALAVLWAALSIYLVLAGRRAREAATVVRAVLDELHRLEEGALSPEDQIRAVAQIATRLDRVTLLRVAAHLADRSPLSEGFARAVTNEHSLDWFVQQASASRGPRANWRRIAALRLLAHQGYSGIVQLLGDAVSEPDTEIAGAALAILGRTPDMKAAEILVNALKSARYSPSRLATFLDRFPLPIAALLRPLLHHPDATVRYWAVTLLARHRSIAALETEIGALTADPAPLVRRAAVASLAQLNPPAAAMAARPLLADPVWFVRAHAARAIAETEDSEFARDVAPLLADREWWVRTAAKESLQRMGPEVWSALVPYLDHADAFARNGAAEVLQNIGILDSLIILEAATIRPSAEKIELLRKIASAGGTRMTEALLDRVDQHTRPRVRDLLASLGLEPAGAPS
jgi:HEAT repeat protein